MIFELVPRGWVKGIGALCASFKCIFKPCPHEERICLEGDIPSWSLTLNMKGHPSKE